MWALKNHTPFAAERSFARDRNGAEVFLVVVKGTYRIHPDGSTSLAEEQEAIHPAPVYRGEAGASSLLYEADLILGKPATDVIVNGHACTPSGAPDAAVEVSLRVGPIFKRALVIGDRVWEKAVGGARMTDPAPFSKMPLVYERAFGGSAGAAASDAKPEVEARNPIGVGLARTAAEILGKKAPNVESPGSLIRAWDDRPAPVGLGPIARDWAPRLGLAGTHDAQWQRDRMPLPPLDYDERFLQCAPEDQQVPGYLKGGEDVELRGMTPGGALRFKLPRPKLGVAIRKGGRTERHEPSLHTVIIEPDHPRVIVVWHAAAPCHHAVYTLRWATVSLAEDA